MLTMVMLMLSSAALSGIVQLFPGLKPIVEAPFEMLFNLADWFRG